jgi:hypothetical protein
MLIVYARPRLLEDGGIKRPWDRFEEKPGGVVAMNR